MTEADFLNLVLQLWRRMARAVNTGAAWEIWLQVELAGLMLEHYNVMAREVRYPGTAEKVDLAFTLGHHNYYIEIKVESATSAQDFAGVSQLRAMYNDVTKLRTFAAPPGSRRWVLCVAYSDVAKQNMRTMKADGMYTEIDLEGPFSAAIVNVDTV